MRELEQRLYNAIMSQNLADVKQAIQDGADINSSYYEDYAGHNLETALHIAAGKSSADIVGYLIDNGWDIYEIDENSNIPLHYAVSEGNIDVIQVFMDKGCDFKKYNLLSLAAQKGRLDVMQFLLDNGVEINRRGVNGNTALYDAVQRDVPTVKFLLRNKADINTRNDEGETLLYIAARSGPLEVVKFLLDKGVDINTQDNEGFTPLRIAAIRSRLDISKLLIQHILLQDYSTRRPPTLMIEAELFHYWNKCKAEIETMRNFNLDPIEERQVSLYNFLRTKDDTKLVQYFINFQNEEKLENLQANNCQDFPICANLLSSKIEEGKRKNALYLKANEAQFTIGDKDTLEISECINKNLGNDNKSRLNLVLAGCPSSHVERPGVERVSSEKRGLAP